MIKLAGIFLIMTPRSLPVFQKKKWYYISLESGLLIVFTMLLFAVAYLDKVASIDLGNWVVSLSILWFLYMLSTIIVNNFRHEKELGEYVGCLVFHQDKIELSERVFDLSSISHIDLSKAYDVRGTSKNHMVSMIPRLSNGLDNTFNMTLVSGENVSCNFLQTETEKLAHFREVLVHYHKFGILSWLGLIKTLEIEDYDEIQSFKRQIG